MLLDLYIYPHPILTRVADPVDTFDETLKELVQNMYETMVCGNGVGLAAPQVGISKRLFIVDTSRPDEPSTLKVYINPKIILKDDPLVWNEGCLSLPGLYRDVKSFGHVIVEAQDVHGETFREEATDLRAVAILHEYAHLDGSVFIDRIAPVKRNLTKKFWFKKASQLTEQTYKDTKLNCIFGKKDS